MTDSEAIIVNYDPNVGGVPADRRTVARKGVALHVRPLVPGLRADSGPLRGVLLRQQVGRSEAKKLYPYLPLTQADIDAKAAAGQDVDRSGAARPVAADSHEQARGEEDLLMACSRRGCPAICPSRTCRRWTGSSRRFTLFTAVKGNGVERAAPAQRLVPAESSHSLHRSRKVTCIMGGYLFSYRTCRKAPVGLSKSLACPRESLAGGHFESLP